MLEGVGRDLGEPAALDLAQLGPGLGLVPGATIDAVWSVRGRPLVSTRSSSTSRSTSATAPACSRPSSFSGTSRRVDGCAVRAEVGNLGVPHEVEAAAHRRRIVRCSRATSWRPPPTRMGSRSRRCWCSTACARSWTSTASARVTSGLGVSVRAAGRTSRSCSSVTRVPSCSGARRARRCRRPHTTSYARRGSSSRCGTPASSACRRSSRSARTRASSACRSTSWSSCTGTSRRTRRPPGSRTSRRDARWATISSTRSWRSMRRT